MRKYNYFDDEQENEANDFSKKLSELRQKIKIEEKEESIKRRLDEITHGETAQEIMSSPDRQIKALWISVAVIFAVALLLFIIIFSHSVKSEARKSERFEKDAGEVCLNYITEYGAAKWEVLSEEKYGENQARLLGLCYVREMDFDNDGTSELMLCYCNKNVYYLEVWGYSKNEFIQLYSDEANSTDKQADGSRVGFYRKNNKYYICKTDKSKPDKVKLYALKGDKFKQRGSCSYDFSTDTYSIKGKDNTEDFETIKLSVFRKSKADIIVELVTKNIDSFGNITAAALSRKKPESELKAQAYYEIIKKKHEKYSKAKIKTENDYSYIDGLAFVRLIDFDGDNNEELFIAYRRYKSMSKYDSYSGEYIYYDVPMYGMEVYRWNGVSANRIFSKESISSCLMDENENVFYILLKKGEKATHICNNTYSFENGYSYTASSKIYKLKNEKFETVYSAKLVNNYGYKQYYVDNERMYSSYDFEKKGHNVPLFLDDDGTYDKSKYSLTYLSGREEEKFDDIVNETVKTIQQINPDYVPGDSEE